MSSLRQPHGNSWQTLWKHEEEVSSVASWGGLKGPEDVTMAKAQEWGREGGDVD